MQKFIKAAEEAPCKQACPAGIDIPRYIRLIRNKKYNEALGVIREKIPLPSVCGRICFRPCEEVCKTSALGTPVAINALKRFAADEGNFEETNAAESTGKRAAVIGSGPAGLTCAYYLAKLGHDVTIFDEMPEPGGMMRVGIPSHRLPRDVLDEEIDRIKAVGVEIRTDYRVESLDEIFAKGFDVVFVGTGAPKGRKLGCEGEDNPAIKDGLSFLKDVNTGKEVTLGEKVGVIGGGNVAIDSARVARRLGCEDVTILYRRSRTEMPAHAEEIEEALNEGVNIIYLVAPDNICQLDDGLSLECLRMELGEPDPSGRLCCVPVEGGKLDMPFDNIIVAVGQGVELPEAFDLNFDHERNSLKMESDTLETSRKGVFAGGDVVSGPATVIQAIAMGRQAAQSMDRFLGGEGRIDEKLVPVDEEVMPVILGLPVDKRVGVPKVPVEKRLTQLLEVEATYSEKSAIEEATRCLQCDLPIGVDGENCTVCMVCQMICAFKFTGNSFNALESAIELKRTPLGTCEATFTDQCDNCGLCARYCAYGALWRGEYGFA